MEEKFPLVDKDGNVTGEATRNECHSLTFLLHPVIHCIITNSKGQWLLQKRSMDKDVQPGKWDTSVGGHVQAGESIEDALKREVMEEVGIDILSHECKFLHEYIMRSDVEEEYVYSFFLVKDSGFVKQDSEIDELTFFDIDEIKSKLGSGFFTPNFEDEFNRVIGKHV